MRSNKKLKQTTADSKEYKVYSGKYDLMFETCPIDRKPYRNWKLYRTKQHKNI